MLYDSEHDSSNPRTMSQLRKEVARSELVAKKDENNNMDSLIEHSREDKIDTVLKDYSTNQIDRNLLPREETYGALQKTDC